MNGLELLEELRNNVLRDASDEIDPKTSGALWDDTTLVRYINDGLVRFAVETCMLRDETTPALTRITLQEGVDTYPLDPRVVAVYGARYGSYHLHRTTYGSLLSSYGDTTRAYAIEECPRTGAPSQFYTDRETGKLGVYPAPDASWDGRTVTLRVARKPLTPLVASNLSAVPEIPEEYHLDILEWAAWRALRNHDVDAENMAKASMHKKRFEDAVKELSRKMKRLSVGDIQFDSRTNWET